ncbi:hypothetical protein [Achromobacter deleyi]|uniref:hypothetical protein n=2 Tax=Achromobacter deleyi TaxID=1353891 RepID=UPI001F3F1E8C|nr:hypothetical protein [Achromobacter deleyi]UIP19529.1 hypothetical protein LYZ39_21435 [Achromobacter deleyi]
MIMAPHTAPDLPAHRLEIAPGASRLLALRAGAAVICTEGSVRVEETANGSEAAGGLHRVVSARVNAGEVHGVAYGGSVRLTAIGGAQVICLDAEGSGSRFFRQATALIQRILPKNRNNSLGALHKISK